MYFLNRHGYPKGEILFLYAQKVVRRLMESDADLFKEAQGRMSTPADDIREMLGTAPTPLRSPLIAEVFCITELEQRNR